MRFLTLSPFACVFVWVCVGVRRSTRRWRWWTHSLLAWECLGGDCHSTQFSCLCICVRACVSISSPIRSPCPGLILSRTLLMLVVVLLATCKKAPYVCGSKVLVPGTVVRHWRTWLLRRASKLTHIFISSSCFLSASSHSFSPTVDRLLPMLLLPPLLSVLLPCCPFVRMRVCVSVCISRKPNDFKRTLLMIYTYCSYFIVWRRQCMCVCVCSWVFFHLYLTLPHHFVRFKFSSHHCLTGSYAQHTHKHARSLGITARRNRDMFEFK